MSSPYKQTKAGKFLISLLLSIVIGANSAFLPIRSSTPKIRPVASNPPALVDRPHSPETSSSLGPADPEIRKLDQRTHNRAKEKYGNLPLSFEINKGQTDSEVKFVSRGAGYNLFLTANESVIVLNKSAPRKTNEGQRTVPAREQMSPNAVVRMKLVGANQQSRVTGLDELPGKSNYFIGNDAKKWRTNISQYARVKYEAVYRGVDVVYYGNQRQLEYDFIVAPGANASLIKLSFDGARKLHVDRHGNLLIATPAGEIKQHRPDAYQELKGHKQQVTSRYVLIGKQQVAIQIGAYDHEVPLIVDPVLAYSTFFGGTAGDEATAIAVDEFNNVYLTGGTGSIDFPTANPFQSVNNGGSTLFLTDVFVSKLNAAGSAIIYSTYLGGTDSEVAYDLAIDLSGNAYLTGKTYSSNFPMANAVQGTFRGLYLDAFVTKLNTTGDTLIYSTYLGGDAGGDNEGGYTIKVDSLGSAYVGGITDSLTFPTTPNCFQPTTIWNDSTEGFVTKFSPTGASLEYSTYVGGNGFDFLSDLAIDSSGNAYITGLTSSIDYPTANPIQPSKIGPSDAFITKLNAAGSALIYSTYLGGGYDDHGEAIAVDSYGSVYVAGATTSTDFPTVNAFQSVYGGGVPPFGAPYQDGFVTKLSATGAGLVYSTYLGGNNDEYVHDIAIDSAGNAYVSGRTFSSNFPTAFPLQSTRAGTDDAFLTKVGATGSVILFSTYLGGASGEYAAGVAVDSTGSAYLTGQTCSSDYPTVNPLRPYNGACDAFVSKISGLNTYAISGKISDANGAGLATVTVTLSGSQSGTAQSDAAGNYSFPNVAGAGNYTITPSKSPYTFVPASRTFNNLGTAQTADFTVATYSISGSVTGFANAPTSGVTVVLSGTQANTTQTDVNGNYSFPSVAEGGSYTVTPSKVDPILTYAFTPASQSVSSLSANQIINFTSLSSIISALNATADAYAQDGTGANSNFGSVSPLKVETDSKTNNSKNFDAYFKFDVSGVAGNISSVKLRIFAASSTPAGATTSVYSVSNTFWLESGAGSITWNNKPARSATALTGATATVNSTTFTTYDLDVTAYVKSEKSAGRDVISLALHNPSSSTIFINLNSREASANKPQLIATVGTNPNAAPAVNLTSPAVGATFTSPATITVSANATDSDGSISKVEFYAGTTLIGTTTSSPYQISWGSVAAGNYSLTAVATDNSSAATTSAALPVLVSLPNNLPSVSLSSPLEGTTFSAGSNLTISANASDSNGTISKVEFFAGATLIGTATTPSSGTLYSVVWNNVNSGAYALTAKATDNATAPTTSAPVNINVVAQTGLSPTADAYVRDGASATTNFGTAATLQTQASATAGNNRESYLKFDLTTVTVINKATVRLYGSLSDTTGSNVPAGIYSVATTSWVESGSGSITWNTKPAAGATALATTVISDNLPRWYEFDVTAYLKAEKTAGHNIVSLVVKNTAQSSPFASFNSREAANNQPQLILWSTQARNALLVVGSTTLNTGDNAIKTRLQNLGFTVTVKAAGSNPNSAIQTSDADGKTLVLISSTVTPANVTNKFRNVTVPVLTWEFDLFDDQGMTGTVSGTDFGTATNQTQVSIINSAHPLAAGLAGTPTVAASGSFSWGKPNTNAARIATLTGDATKFVIFGYDNMAAMPGLEAPARRLGLFLTDTTAASFTVNVNGGLLFDAAVTWASELVTAPFINSLTPTSGPLGTVVTIRGGNFGSAPGTSKVTFNGVAATPTVWGYSSVTVGVPVFATTGPVVITVSGVASNAVTFAVGDTDSDGDGLPDWWELQYFGNLNQNASGDADGDGLTNLQEYQQGRNPTKSALADDGDFVNLKLYTPLAAPSP